VVVSQLVQHIKRHISNGKQMKQQWLLARQFSLSYLIRRTAPTCQPRHHLMTSHDGTALGAGGVGGVQCQAAAIFLFRRRFCDQAQLPQCYLLLMGASLLLNNDDGIPLASHAASQS
jgi:hypothetical protein